jgi:hypothetical protein
MNTPSSGKRDARMPDCPRHDEVAASLGPRDVDMQEFRLACANLLERLEAVGLSQDYDVEQRRQRLMQSVSAVLAESGCGETMIQNF